jgi:hypothetical protein
MNTATTFLFKVCGSHFLLILTSRFSCISYLAKPPADEDMTSTDTTTQPTASPQAEARPAKIHLLTVQIHGTATISTVVVG